MEPLDIFSFVAQVAAKEKKSGTKAKMILYLDANFMQVPPLDFKGEKSASLKRKMEFKAGQTHLPAVRSVLHIVILPWTAKSCVVLVLDSACLRAPP